MCLFPIEFKDNLTVSTVRNTGETGDIYNPLSRLRTANGFAGSLSDLRL